MRRESNTTCLIVILHAVLVELRLFLPAPEAQLQSITDHSLNATAPIGGQLCWFKPKRPNRQSHKSNDYGIKKHLGFLQQEEEKQQDVLELPPV